MVRKRNKKGSILDLIQIGVILLSLAIVTLIGFRISDELNTEFQSNDAITQDAKDAYADVNGVFDGALDNSFLLLTVGLCLGALFLAFLVRVHPVFFVFYIIILALIIFVTGIFSNIYLEMANNPELSALADRLVFTTHIMATLPFIVGIFGTLLAIVMYKSWREESF